jgi:cobalt-zinc-cadmium resistance protein CzcA
MIGRLVAAAVANRAVVLVLAGILVAVGLYDLRRLPIDAQPDISPRQVLIITQAPGLGPLDVERFVTFPVELALQGLPRMEALRSVTRYGLSVVYVRFSDDTDWSSPACLRCRCPPRPRPRRWARFPPASARSSSSRCAARAPA